MVKGWFVGNFIPSAYISEDFEVAVKKYKSGDYEASHFHKIASEITVITEGIAMMNGVNYSAGSIIFIEPNEKTDFLAITNVVTTVIKIPCVKNDKFLSSD